MRIKRAVSAVKKRRKIMKQAKGYYGGKSRLYRVAKQQVMRSGYYAYVGRKQKKRDFRKLWIARINAAARLNDLSYSKFMHGAQTCGHRAQPQGAGGHCGVRPQSVLRSVRPGKSEARVKQ